MNNASSSALALLHAMERKETTFITLLFWLLFMLIKGSGTSKIFLENECTNTFTSIEEVFANAAGVS